MPHYIYRCDDCGDVTAWQSIHDEPYVVCPECENQPAVKVMTPPNIAAAALETKGASVVEIDAREARWQRDMPAYKSLRYQGIQPKQIDGCDRVAASASSKWEIETGLRVSDEDKIHEGMHIAQEIARTAGE